MTSYLSILASIATILDFMLALYIFISERKPSLASRVPANPSTSNFKGGKQLAIILINALLVAIVLYWGADNLYLPGISETIYLFGLPALLCFWLGFQSPNWHLAVARSVISNALCLFVLVMIVLITIPFHYIDWSHSLSFIVIMELVGGSVGLLAFGVKKIFS